MADDNPINWDNRRMFERYLHDYLKKKNMHQTAEIFRREADVTIDPAVPISIDVPDGFLHEWWLLFYDVFRARQVETHEQNDSPSTMVEKMVANGTQSKASLLQQCEMNKQTLGNLSIGAGYGMTTGESLLPLMGWPLAGPQQFTGALPSFQQQQELVACTPGILHPSENFADLFSQEVGSSIHQASGQENVSLFEKTRNGKKPCNFKDGVSGMRGVAEASSDASAVMGKSKDDGAPSNDNADGKGSSSSYLKRSCGSLKANALKDMILLGGILVKYSTTSCRPHQSTCTPFGISIEPLMP